MEGEPRPGKAWSGLVQQAKAGRGGHGQAWISSTGLGTARPGQARLCEGGGVRKGEDHINKAGRGCGRQGTEPQRTAMHGELGMDNFNRAGSGMRGWAKPGSAGKGEEHLNSARHVRRVRAVQGIAGIGKARNTSTRSGMGGSSRRARQAWHGRDGQGTLQQGGTRLRDAGRGYAGRGVDNFNRDGSGAKGLG